MTWDRRFNWRHMIGLRFVCRFEGERVVYEGSFRGKGWLVFRGGCHEVGPLFSDAERAVLAIVAAEVSA